MKSFSCSKESQKLVILIDSLGSGGAQRQACRLSKLLAEQGNEVTVLTYYPSNFFYDMLDNQRGLNWVNVSFNGQFDRFFKLAEVIKQIRPDCVVAFLEIPCMLSVLLRLWSLGRFRLIVSERNTDLGRPKSRGWVKWILYTGASLVVPNSHSQARYIGKYAPWLRARVRVVINCVDMIAGHGSAVSHGQIVKIVMIGRYTEQKNGLALVKALDHYSRENKELPKIYIDWYGAEPEPEKNFKKRLEAEIDKCQLNGVFRLHNECSEVNRILASSHALILCSHYEGCPNVVCEAMAMGISCIVTNVGDNAYLIRDGVEGVVVDNTSFRAIADGLARFSQYDMAARDKMGEAARSRAESLLTPTRFAREWSKAIHSI